VNLLLITAPIFLLIAFGYALRAFGVLNQSGIHALNNFVYWVALPAIILVSFWGINLFDAETRAVFLVNTAGLLAFALALFIALRLLPLNKKTKAGIFVSALVGNTVFMGFPIAERVFEGGGAYDLFLAAATPHLVIGIAISIAVIEWYMLGSKSPLRYVKNFFLNPLILALAGGIALGAFNVSGGLIDPLKQSITMLAATASPIALVALGAFLRGAFKFRLAIPSFLAAGVKLLALPLFIYGAGLVFALDAEAVTASVLAAAMPTAVTSFVIAEKYHAASELVATTLFMSTILSFFTITLVFPLFT
jgi:predicted permease